MQPRTRQRVAIATGTVAGLTALAALAGVVLLPVLVEDRAEAALRGAGFPDPLVQLDRIGFGGAEAGVRLAGNQGIDHVAIRWTPGGLLDGRVESVILEGLRLELEVGDGALQVVGRTPPTDAAADAGAPLIPDLPLDTVELRRASLTVQTPAGPLTVPLDGTLTRTAPGTYRMSGTAVVEALGARGLATVEARFAPDSGLVAEVALDPPAGPEAAGTGALAGRVEIVLAPGQPLAGTAALRLKDMVAPVAGAVSGELDWRVAQGSHGVNLTLTAQHGLAGRFVAAVEPQAEGPPLAAVDGALDAPDLKALAGLLGLEAPVAGKAALKLHASGPAGTTLPPVTVELRVDGAAWEGWVADGTVQAAGRLLLDGDTARFESAKEVFAEGRPGDTLRDVAPEVFAKGPLSLSLRPGAEDAPLAVTLAREGGKRTATLAGRMGVKLGAVVLGGLARTASLSLDEGGVLAGAATLAEGALEAAALGVTARGLEVDVGYGRGREVPIQATATVASLRLGPGRGWVAPLRLTAEVTGHPYGILAVTASAEGAGGALVIDLAGRHDLTAGTGNGTLVLHPVRFTEGVRAPGDVFPILAGGIDSGTGRIGLRLRHAWGPEAPAGRGELLLEDLSLVGPGFALRGLNGVVVASGLVPLRTPPDQLLSVALLNVGVPLSDGLVRFAVGDGERLTVDEARFGWAEGTVRAQPFAIPLQAPEGTVVLEAAKLQLGRMLELAGVDGLAATGTLDGRIPVIIDGDTVRFEQGRLAAAGAGTIRYDPAVPPSFLDPARNENVALVMQVLEDFRYDDLAVTIDGTVGGEMAVALKLRGSNPDFYGGYPVALNLNLSGALDSILRSGLGTYRIPDEVRARLEQYQKGAP